MAIFLAFNSPEVRDSYMRALGSHVYSFLVRECEVHYSSSSDRIVYVATFFVIVKVEVIGLTTLFGNVKTPMATANALHLLEIVGRTDVPVAEARHAVRL